MGFVAHVFSYFSFCGVFDGGGRPVFARVPFQKKRKKIFFSSLLRSNDAARLARELSACVSMRAGGARAFSFVWRRFFSKKIFFHLLSIFSTVRAEQKAIQCASNLSIACITLKKGTFHAHILNAGSFFFFFTSRFLSLTRSLFGRPQVIFIATSYLTNEWSFARTHGEPSG